VGDASAADDLYNNDAIKKQRSFHEFVPTTHGILMIRTIPDATTSSRGRQVLPQQEPVPHNCCRHLHTSVHIVVQREKNTDIYIYIQSKLSFKNALFQTQRNNSIQLFVVDPSIKLKYHSCVPVVVVRSVVMLSLDTTSKTLYRTYCEIPTQEKNDDRSGEVSVGK
jgi:hypothetical protein